MKNRNIAILGVSMLPVLSFAQTAGTGSSAFTDAVTQATTDIGTFGGALVGLAAVGVAFMIAVKYVKKIRGAA